jgi:hypothetical protein
MMRIGLFGGERIAEESTIVVPFSRLGPTFGEIVILQERNPLSGE